MREWEEATWASGQTLPNVIRRVGEAVAQRALQMTQPGDFILILAGQGHNGDDVRAAREHLKDRRVELLNVTLPTTTLSRLELFLGQNPALVIDGLFGIGLDRPLDGDWIALIARLNGVQVPVLSVDVPSGLDADTGMPFGAVVRATVTLTIGAPKQGLLPQSVAGHVGRLEVVSDVGLVPCPRTAELNWTLPEDFRGFPPPRRVTGHKGSYGHLAIVAGSVGYHGAAVLAARAAARSQPGLITVLPHEPAYYQVAVQLQSAMVRPWTPQIHFPGEFSALLVGPGLAARDLPEDFRVAVRKLWRDSLLPMIVDASALDWLPMDPVPRGVIRVVTPHPGEAARLLKSTPANVQENRRNAVREISKRFGNCWVVLKGHQTLVGQSSGDLFINPSGSPHLAQGGSGDVLAGYIAGLLAQPALQADVGKTLRYAVWQHGATADALQATRRNWVIEDLVAEIGNVS
jgi:NAD(P)H-hydrate epimerase